MIIHVSSSRRSRPTNGRSFLPSPRSSHHWNGKSATTKGKITTHTTTECAGDGVVIGEECRYEKWLECDEICQSRKRQPDREMLYKVSFSPHRDASVIDKKHPRRLAWHQTIKPHPHPHRADVGLMHSCELLFVFPTSSASAIC